MTSNVEPAEAEALLEPDGAAAPSRDRAVSERDFSQPHRLSVGRLASLRGTMLASLPEVERFLRSVLSDPCQLDVTDIAEVNAEGLFDQPEFPITMGRFKVDGQPGWIVWQNRAAVAAIEKIFGSEGEGGRELSRVEKRVLLEILSGVARSVAKRLNKKDAEDFEVVDDVYAIGDWRDGPEGRDSHRLCVSISAEGPFEASTFHVYLPGFQPAGDAGGDDDAPAAPLPSHLEEVRVRITAELGRVEIPLSGLMQLEPGDVIPLTTRVDTPLPLFVEELPSGRAKLGTHRGQLALTLTEIPVGLPTEDEDDPEEVS